MRSRAGRAAPGPADGVTLARAALACAWQRWSRPSVAAQPRPCCCLVGLAVVALVLDAVDGRSRGAPDGVARSARGSTGRPTRSCMLVLSVYVAAAVGAWVLAIGAARYVFAAAGWVLPRLRAALPPRYWRKVVTAVAGDRR